MCSKESYEKIYCFKDQKDVKELVTSNESSDISASSFSNYSSLILCFFS